MSPALVGVSFRFMFKPRIRPVRRLLRHPPAAARGHRLALRSGARVRGLRHGRRLGLGALHDPRPHRGAGRGAGRFDRGGPGGRRLLSGGSSGTSPCPQLFPVVMIVVILKSIFSLKTFDQIYMLTNGGPGDGDADPRALRLLQRVQVLRHGLRGGRRVADGDSHDLLHLGLYPLRVPGSVTVILTNRRKRRFGEAIRLVLVLIVALVMMIPIAWIALAAFKQHVDVYQLKLLFRPTLENFALVFDSPYHLGRKLLELDHRVAGHGGRRHPHRDRRGLLLLALPDARRAGDVRHDPRHAVRARGGDRAAVLPALFATSASSTRAWGSSS